MHVTVHTMKITNLLSKLKPLLGNQRGAIFGMDARIAVIVASILAATGGITILSRLDSTNVDQTERHLETLRTGLLDYYANIGITQLPEELEILFQENIIEETFARRDAWGNQWDYSFTEEVVAIEGTEVTMRHAVIFSRGKDGLADSQSVFNPEDFTEWNTKGDDLGIKVTTREVELKRLEEYRARGQLVIDKIQDVEAKNYLIAVGDCESTSPAEYCEDQKGKNYTQFNYYPKSSLDSNAEEVVYYEDTTGDATLYEAGNLNDMRQLMRDVGLPETYASDPWGRVLNYHSNITGRENPPFSASICYAQSGNCFSEN